MEPKKFQMRDEEFTCVVCQKQVLPLEYTARDHCPHCLCSLHLDDNPGDRLCLCHGIMQPFAVEKGKKDILKIVYRCHKCGMIKKNKAAIDDNYDLILEVMKNTK